MPQFEGVAMQFENKTNGFSFRLNGEAKYSFQGNNVEGIVEGDYVVGTYSVESFPDKQNPTRKVNWNKVAEIHKSTPPQGDSAVPAQGTGARSTPPHHKAGGDFVFPIPADNYQRSVVRREVLAVAQANMGEGSDRMEVLRLAKLFEAYCCGDFDVPPPEGG